MYLKTVAIFEAVLKAGFSFKPALSTAEITEKNGKKEPTSSTAKMTKNLP
jgi:hypothetical protein